MNLPLSAICCRSARERGGRALAEALAALGATKGAICEAGTAAAVRLAPAVLRGRRVVVVPVGNIVDYFLFVQMTEKKIVS